MAFLKAKTIECDALKEQLALADERLAAFEQARQAWIFERMGCGCGTARRFEGVPSPRDC